MNQQLDLSIPVVGEPAPDCKWTLNGQEVKSADNVKVIIMVINDGDVDQWWSMIIQMEEIGDYIWIYDLGWAMPPYFYYAPYCFTIWF